MNEITIKDTVIEIAVKEIIDVQYDAIVVPSNSRLLPSGSLRCQVLKQAGPKVQIECNKIINKVTKIPIGNAVITSAGNLNAKYLIHVVGPRLGVGQEGKKLMLATWNTLKVADKAGIKTVALNPISIENLGFNTKICAQVMLPTIKKFILEQNKNLEKITIFLTDLPEYKDFEKVLNALAK